MALSLDGAQRRRRAPTACIGRGGGIVLLVFVQILLGALVAGLKAGTGYNTWPLMDGRLVPSGLGAMQPWYLNLFENAMTVQFNHRVVAYVLVARRALACMVRAARRTAMRASARRPWCLPSRYCAGGARHLDPARAGAAGAGPCAPGGRGRRVRDRVVAPAHPAAGLTQPAIGFVKVLGPLYLVDDADRVR